jgi:hypothetical protein
MLEESSIILSDKGPPVGVVSGDAQIPDRHCATDKAVRRNADDISYYASSIAQALLEA